MYPTETTIHEGTAHEAIELRHPAMGVIVVTRGVNAKPTQLFGSGLVHRTIINVCIYKAHVDRSLHKDWTRTDELIVEFDLSSSQWAQLVSSMGLGEGTKITLDRVPEEGSKLVQVPMFERETSRATFNTEIQASASQASKAITDVQAAMDKFLEPGAKNPTKAELKELRESLRHAGSHFVSNMSFMQDSFDSAIQHTTESAKTEVENYIDGIIQRTGLQALADSGMLALPHIPE